MVTFFSFPTIIFSQNLDSELMKIDSIVKYINDTDGELSEGIVEGPIIYRGWFKKNGGWGAYYLRNKQKPNEPMRILYNLAFRKSYESYEFYYSGSNLIFAKLSVTYYRKKYRGKSFEREYYFQNSKLIFDSKPEMEKFNVDYILLTENSTRKLIFK